MQNNMTISINALSARTRFGELIDQVGEKHLRFLINRRGKPKAVILGVDDYLQNIFKKPKMLVEIQEEAQKAGLDQISDDDIQSEIDAYRAIIK